MSVSVKIGDFEAHPVHDELRALCDAIVVKYGVRIINVAVTWKTEPYFEVATISVRTERDK